MDTSLCARFIGQKRETLPGVIVIRVEPTLNEKVGFKIPTTRYRKNSILCGALHIRTAKWTSGVGWSFGASRPARGIKGSGTGMTFDPLRRLSDLITKQKKIRIHNQNI